MSIRLHHRGHGVAQICLLLAVTSVATLNTLLVAGSSPAAATATPTDGQRVDVTINVAALPLTNSCNGDVVNLSGDMRIVTVTRPTNNGGYTVSSTARADNLKGNRIVPSPAIGYVGDQTEDSYSYYAPPPYPGTSRIAHWTRLIPQGPVPAMWLVVVFRYTIAVDGTLVPLPESAYLKCSEPRSHSGS